MVWATIYRLRTQRVSKPTIRRVLITVDCLILFVGSFLIVFTFIAWKNTLESVICIPLLSIGIIHIALADLYNQKFKKI